MGQKHSHPQQTANNAPVSLRHASDCAYKARNEAFAASQAAYKRGDHATSKQKSQEGKALDKKAKQLSLEAANHIFLQNNRGRPPGEVDLHGLHVAEALAKVEEKIKLARQPGSGINAITFVVGKGLHSDNGDAKIKPAVLEFVNKYSLRVTEGKPNDGCLFVELVAPSKKGFFSNLVSSGCTIC